ncbi:MAG: tRNA threonylcarbamoyl adenosine modification protein (Sua5/YciO/YrdC/YwlC family) [Myxococcota bacterium]|jgi:tRNA threonylcarbamoyl adenosine modification protein (Sua5/YciO/YrdC/YwlC family)
MNIIQLDRDVPEIWTLGPAVEALKRGELVIFPTDSVYAIGCDPFDAGAVGRLYKAKKMDKTKRCSVICADLKQVSTVARAVSNDGFRFMRRYFPGPFTLLLKASLDLPTQAHGRRKSIGVRIPDHPVPQALVEDFGRPLLVTSVPGWELNEPVDPVAVANQLYVKPTYIIDMGLQIAEPSTVIDFTTDEPEIVRQGKGIVED